MTNRYSHRIGMNRGASRRPQRPRPLGRFEPLEDRRLLSVGAQEQLFVYLLNVARHDPSAYQAQQNLPVDLSYVDAQPPVAVNELLFNSSEFHATEMAEHDYFGHQSQVTGDWPNQMVRDAGYAIPASWTSNDNYVESLAAGTYWDTASEVLDALVIDEGVPSLGHRNHLLSIGSFQEGNREIGVGWARNASATYTNYWAIHLTRHDPSDTFATGVVYNDANNNLRYDLGEGLSGATVHVGNWTTTTNAAGGWSVAVTPGTYSVSVSGGGFSGTATSTVSFAGENVEIDFLSGRPFGVVDFGGDAAPSAVADGYQVQAGTAYQAATSVVANDVDTDGDRLTASLVSNPAHGTLQFNADGTFRYTPAAGYVGTDSFTYRASDGFSRSGVATVTLTVSPDAPTPVDLGTLALSVQTDLNLSAGARWYEFTTTRAGTVTAEATLAAAGDAQLTLYNASQQPLATSTVIDGRPRIDYQASAAGTTYLLRATGTSSDVDLRLANLVSRSGANVAVAGTAGDDFFDFDARSLSFTIDELTYSYAGTGASQFSFDGGAGDDGAYLRGSTSGDSATVNLLSASLQGAGFSVSAGSVASLVIRGQGGADTATVYGSSGADTYQGSPTEGKLISTGFLGRVLDFGQVVVHSGGGADVARLYDSAGDEEFVASPSLATLSGTGFSHELHGFGEVHAFADSGGDDTAELHDSAADDVFDGLSTESRLYSAGLFLRAKGFDRVEAIAEAGGDDAANLYGARTDDTFLAAPLSSSLSGPGFENVATGFEQVQAAGKGGTGDEATFEGSAEVDRYTATDLYGRMAGNGFFLRAFLFDRYYAQAVGAGDVATLNGTEGDEQLTARPEVSEFLVRNVHEVRNFSRINAYAGGGSDTLWLYDSVGDDQFRGVGNLARLFTPSAAFYLYDFTTVTADGSTGRNERSVSSTDYALTFTGTWVDV